MKSILIGVLAMLVLAASAFACEFPEVLGDVEFLCANTTFTVSDVEVLGVLDCQGAKLIGTGTGIIITGRKGAVRNCIFEGFDKAIVVDNVPARIEYNTFINSSVYNNNGTLLLKGNVGYSVWAPPKVEAPMVVTDIVKNVTSSKSNVTNYAALLEVSAYNSAIIVQIFVGMLVLMSIGSFVIYELRKQNQ